MVYKSGQIFVTIHACDGRTDRQTDRNLITIPRLHYMQRGKNHIVLSPMKPPKRLGCLEEQRDLPQWGPE